MRTKTWIAGSSPAKGLFSVALPRQPPIGPARGSPGAPRALLDRGPLARDIGRVEVEAYRQEAVLAGQLQGLRARADARDPDRRVGFLERPDVRDQAFQHPVG